MIAMTNPMILWYAVVGVLMLVLVCNSLRYFHGAGSRRIHHFIEIGKERDMFFAPGDSTNDGDDDYCL